MKTMAIQFSGGKDSLAALYVMRAFGDSARIYLGNTGALYPHMLDFVRATCARLGLELAEVAPPMPVDEYHRRAGLPSDILPIDATAEMRAFTRQAGVTLQSPMSCCAAMLWLPLQRRMIEDGIQVIVRGSKACDERVGVPDGHVDERGVIYLSPLWNWSDDQVFAYLRQQGAELPRHYAEAPASFECMTCTGFLNDRGAAQRLAWTRRNYPEAWPAIAERLQSVRDTARDEQARLAASFECLEDG